MTGLHHLPTNAVDKAVAKSLLVTFPPALRTRRRRADPRLYDCPDGRQITVRYARPGELLGIPAIVGGPAPVSVQILADSALLLLNVRALQKAGQTEPGVGWLMAQEVTRRLYDTLEALAGNAFGSLRQRVARHLLDLAAVNQALEAHGYDCEAVEKIAYKKMVQGSEDHLERGR